MSDVGRISSGGFNPDDINAKRQKNEKEIELDDISILYSTTKKEEDRTTFDETFDKVSLMDSEAGREFLSGLKKNKAVLMGKLGLTDEQYDSLACVALALASQETGMGKEDGYVSENTGIGKFFRTIAKWFSTTFGNDSSASSGLTQMKIYDFLNNNGLSDDMKQILKDYGVEAKGINNNNLYENPDKSAIATMVILTSIYENYDEYQNVLKTEHEAIGKEISGSPEYLEGVEKKGNQLMSDILSVYKNAPDDQKIAIRSTFKQWLLSVNGSKKGDKGDKDYNEEIQMEKLNEILAKNNADFQLSEDSLHFIRYALTADGKEMSVPEYCAYGWNKGTSKSGMQLDRMLAEKIGTILYNPEDFDYDQFTTNVATLAEKYANQSVESDGLYIMNSSFFDEIDW